MVLSLGEAHLFVLLLTELVWEDDHQVFAREVFLQFVRQPLQCVLIGDGAFSGGDNYEKMVFCHV